MNRRWIPRLVGGAVAMAVVALSVSGSARGRPNRVDPEADRVLRDMSRTLAGLQSFSFSADHTLEAVTKSGQKLQFIASSDVAVKRPDRMRSDRKGQLIDGSLYYDGKSITVYGRKANLYATAAAPATLDKAIDFARERFDLDAPAADLIYSDPYKMLMEDVVSGEYVGKAEIDDRTCHHLAYRGRQTDWQIWIEDGKQAIPCKYLIVSKQVRGHPEFSVEFHDWELDAGLKAEHFEFKAPSDAIQIEFFNAPKGAKVTRR